MLTLSGFEDVVSQQELSVFDNGRYEEIVQMLSDLGYLTISAEEGKIVSTFKLQTAVYTFRKEAISGLLISKSSLQLPFPEIPKEHHEGILTYREFSILQLLVSLDGDFTLKPISEISNIGIYIRVLQYRLHLLGLLEQHPDGYFTDQIKLALDKLSEWLSPVKSDELLDLTGNITKLISHIKENKAFANKIVYFSPNPKLDQDEHSRQKWEAYSRYYNIIGQNRSFLKQLGKDIDRKSLEYKELKSDSRRIDFDQELFNEKCNDDHGNFLIRLMQIAQWISGYYLGEIDGKLGEFTFESFLQLVQGEKENGNINFETYLFIGSVSKDLWVVNPHYLLREMTRSETDIVDLNSRVFDSFDKEYKKLDEVEKKTVDENMSTAWRSINVDFSSDMKSTAHRFRRIYYGARSLLQSFWKGFKSIFNKLKDDVKSFFNGLTNMVKNFAKFLYREIREALQIFSRGLNFLFGKRELETKDCVTKFDFDLDCVTYNTIPLTDSSVKDHHQLLVATTTGLTFCLTLTGRIIHLVMIAGLGWQRLLIEAGIMLKKMVKEWYSEREYSGYVIDPKG